MNENNNNYIYLDLTSQKHPSDFSITVMQLTRGQLSVDVELQDSPWVAQGERRGLVLDLDAALTVSWETHDEPVQRSRKQRVRGSPFSLLPVLDPGLWVAGELASSCRGRFQRRSPALSSASDWLSQHHVIGSRLSCYYVSHFVISCSLPHTHFLSSQLLLT